MLGSCKRMTRRTNTSCLFSELHKKAKKAKKKKVDRAIFYKKECKKMFSSKKSLFPTKVLFEDYNIHLSGFSSATGDSK